MSIEQNQLSQEQHQKDTPVDWATQEVKQSIHTLLHNASEDIILTLSKIERSEKWFAYNKDTLAALLDKYPSLTVSEFHSYFLSSTYNKNLLMCAPEIIDMIDLNNLSPGDDIVEHIIQKISLSESDFRQKVQWKMDTLTFPNLSSGDVAQWYFFSKLKNLLPETKIIFWDMVEIRENFWKNQFNCDSVWFIDLTGNGLFNTCLLKLIKTPPVQEKIDELNQVFSQTPKDIFIGWSTFNIPFSLPDELYGISMPKMPSNGINRLNLLPNGALINSMWYLNSAYYADKVKASFVLGSHNIAEPMHAGKLTVINNDPKNRYNHNWLISYFWEKSWLLHYMEGSEAENQERINDFLSIPREELNERYKKFQELYESEILPLVYWLFYSFLKKNFPEYIN